MLRPCLVVALAGALFAPITAQSISILPPPPPAACNDIPPPIAPPVPATAPAPALIWFASEHRVQQLDPETNRIVQSLEVDEAQALAPDPSDASLWVRTSRQIIKFDAHGVPILRRDLPSLGEADEDEHGSPRMMLNPYDGSLWVGGKRQVLHLDKNGALLGTLTPPDKVRALALALDESLWVLGQRQIWHYSAQGALLASLPLPGGREEAPRFLVVDSLGGLLWFAGEQRLMGLDPSGSSPPLLISLSSGGKLEGLALDGERGSLWVLSREALTAYGREGGVRQRIVFKAPAEEREASERGSETSEHRTRAEGGDEAPEQHWKHEDTDDPGAAGLRDPQSLAYDPVSQSLWVGHEKGVSRFSIEGQLLARLPVEADVEVLGTAPFALTPTLTLIEPPFDALTNNPRPPIRLALDALCTGRPCGLAKSYLGAYRLSALLNKQPIGDLFAFDAATGERRYLPAARLPECINVLEAQAEDPFGHATNRVQSFFTLDTIPPKFLSLSPPEGSVFFDPAVTIQGSIDKFRASVVIEGVGQATNTTVTGAILSFSFPVILRPGLNTFTLTAIDRAGNVATVSLHLSYVPVSVTVTSPANGATIDGDSVIVSGTFQGPPNTGVVVKSALGAVAAALAGNRFYATVPLQPGSNPLTVTATRPDGLTASQSVTVMSTGPAPIRVRASPSSGIGPLSVSFIVQNDTANAVTRIEASFGIAGRNDLIDFITTNPFAPIEATYQFPSVYQAKVRVTDSTGKIYTSTLLIQVMSFAEMDVMLRSIYTGMLDKLRAGDVEGALTAVSGSLRDKYLRIFTALKPNLATVVDRLGTLQSGAIGGDIAEYAVVRDTPTGKRTFLIYFLRGEDALWRIDGM